MAVLRGFDVAHDCLSLGLVAGNFVSAKLAGRAEPDRMILLGSLLALLGGGIGLALSVGGHWTPLAVFALASYSPWGTASPCPTRSRAPSGWTPGRPDPPPASAASCNWRQAPSSPRLQALGRAARRRR